MEEIYSVLAATPDKSEINFLGPRKISWNLWEIVRIETTLKNVSFNLFES